MILLTFDTSTESEAAFEVAADLAARFNEPLHILLVIDGPLRAVFAEQARAKGADTSVDDVAQEILNSAIERASALTGNTTGSFRHAIEAGPAIVQATEDEEVILAVMATHGRSGLSRLLAGSVTDYVIRNSNVPVVAVPVNRK